jgi:hypothetical protein
MLELRSEYSSGMRQIEVESHLKTLYFGGLVPMANIQINQIKIEEPTEKMIDLKAEAEKGNSKAFAAFTTLRGGMSANCCWCSVADF